MNFLISPAYAQSVGGGGAPQMITSLLPFVGIFVVFYFIVIRPQQNKAKQLREQLKALRRGDKIVTAGGIIGTIVRNREDTSEIEIEIAPNVKVMVLRNTITTVLESKAPQANENQKVQKIDKKQEKVVEASEKTE